MMTETCPCGARIDAPADYPSLIKGFRDAHSECRSTTEDADTDAVSRGYRMGWDDARELRGGQRFGDRVEDGGLMGTIVRCHECGGTGELPQPVEPESEEQHDH